MSSHGGLIVLAVGSAFSAIHSFYGVLRAYFGDGAIENMIQTGLPL